MLKLKSVLDNFLNDNNIRLAIVKLRISYNDYLELKELYWLLAGYSYSNIEFINREKLSYDEMFTLFVSEGNSLLARTKEMLLRLKSYE